METVQDTSEKKVEEKPKAESADKLGKAAKPAIGTSAGAKTKTVQSEIPDDPVKISRRRTVWALFSGFLVINLVSFFKFFLPRALFEPSTVFRIGFPSDYAIGVDTKFQQQYRVWVVRNTERLFVIYAKCTHLGCTPDWKPSENKFKCPCHGSGYDSEGVNFEGPAPRPMDRAQVRLDPDGQVVVNIATLYAWERDKGRPSRFNEDGAYIST
jgi:cytochrome b6-f complex iron-sulfur subunit